MTAGIITGMAGVPSFAYEFPKVEDFTTICMVTSNDELCDATKLHFKSDWQNAIAGSYEAQRNIAFCLSTGCDGAVTVNPVDACAWRMVIQASPAKRQDTELQSYRQDCKLSNIDRRKALALAEEMYQAIYNKQMPVEKLLRN
ncbi:hypothetical protein IB237_23425 [Agrobacterium sp. AGB01]|uniref:hypothetical protein n=1 Tax=Agrobacterium sp. AGB01 TaxID=2769302 RepID=UPI00177FC1E3|nr:hypothetical protein [Agrobacterium sp. AGB01]